MVTSQETLFIKSVLAVAVAIISTQTWSAGFQLSESSPSDPGQAYPGEGAIADNAGNASRNPALIVMLDRPTLSAGAVHIDPDVNISGRSPYTECSTDTDNIAPTAWVPNVHFVMPINEQFGWGVSVTSNYDLAIELNDSYIVGEYGGKTDFKTVDLNLSGTYRLNDSWSLGFGFNAAYADAKIERYSGEQTAALPKVGNKIASLERDEWGYSQNAGILYELDKNNRYGLTYRSEIKIDFDGDHESGIRAQANAISGVGTTFPWGTTNAIVPGPLILNFPEMWELSGYDRIVPQWAIHYSMVYASWSQFQELKATGSNGQTLLYKEEGFKDSYRIVLGTTYYMDKSWMFRIGITYDDSPVPASKCSTSIPDQDRLWLGADTIYAFNDDASIDVGVSYMHGQEVIVQEGSYTFDSEGKVWLFGTNFNYAF